MRAQVSLLRVQKVCATLLAEMAASAASSPGGGPMRFVGFWQFWALLSAAFAALTAIFAKIGIENVNSDFATFIRTIVIICALTAFLFATDQWQQLNSVSGRSYLFLVLSGLATGASWVCYFRALKIGKAAQVAPIDKLSVVLVAIFGVLILGERPTIPNWIGVAPDCGRRHPDRLSGVTANGARLYMIMSFIKYSEARYGCIPPSAR